MCQLRAADLEVNGTGTAEPSVDELLDSLQNIVDELRDLCRRPPARANVTSKLPEREPTAARNGTPDVKQSTRVGDRIDVHSPAASPTRELADSQSNFELPVSRMQAHLNELDAARIETAARLKTSDRKLSAKNFRQLSEDRVILQRKAEQQRELMWAIEAQTVVSIRQSAAGLAAALVGVRERLCTTSEILRQFDQRLQIAMAHEILLSLFGAQQGDSDAVQETVRRIVDLGRHSQTELATIVCSALACDALTRLHGVLHPLLDADARRSLDMAQNNMWLPLSPTERGGVSAQPRSPISQARRPPSRSTPPMKDKFPLEDHIEHWLLSRMRNITAADLREESAALKPEPPTPTPQIDHAAPEAYRDGSLDDNAVAHIAPAMPICPDDPQVSVITLTTAEQEDGLAAQADASDAAVAPADDDHRDDDDDNDDDFANLMPEAPSIALPLHSRSESRDGTRRSSSLSSVDEAEVQRLLQLFHEPALRSEDISTASSDVDGHSDDGDIDADDAAAHVFIKSIRDGGDGASSAVDARAAGGVDGQKPIAQVLREAQEALRQYHLDEARTPDISGPDQDDGDDKS